MSLPPHKAYKESGAKWLGLIPTHWSTSRVKVLFEIRKRIAGELGYDVLSVTQKGLKIRDVESNDGQLSMDYSKYQIVDPGDFVMNHMDLLTGYVDASKVQGVTSPDYRVFTPRNDNISRHYFLYLFQNGYHQRIFYAYGQGSSGLGRWRMPTDSFNDFILPVPPQSEQSAIAAFLNRETGKIDALIEEQKRLIVLLKEKRQVVISHAVTKGLNPDAPMKDAGNEWLGEVPEHWTITEIKRYCRNITDGAHISPETKNGVYCFVSTKDLVEDAVDYDGCLRTSKESYEYLVRTGCRPEVGDVLFSKDGTIGRTVVIREKREFVVASSLIIIRPALDLLDPTFLHFLCQTTFVRGQVESFVKGAGLPRLSIQNLLRIVGVFPPLVEQASIASYLVEATARFDKLIREADAAITLLQERRSALISAAVTGKIDVRGLLPDQAEAA